jgi:hypothetical protein
MTTHSLTDISTRTPRVEACINAVMRRFPGSSSTSQARYFEEVHQHLAPLARALECELEAAKSSGAAAWLQHGERKRLADSRAESGAQALAIAREALSALGADKGAQQGAPARRALEQIATLLEGMRKMSTPPPFGDPSK